MCLNKLITGSVTGLLLIGMISPVIALPLSPNDSAVKQLAPATTTNVRGHGWRGGRGWGWGIGLGAFGFGLAAGAYPYYGYEQYYPGPYYPAPAYYGGPVYVGPSDAVGYCMQRFRSYDPRTGTYLGYDGFRHPCP